MIRLGKSCVFALKGIFLSLRKERNLRIEFAIAVLILYFSKYYSLSGHDYAVLFLTIGLVLSAEVFNSAMERFVDLMSPQYSKKAGQIKDIAAGGVLITALLSVAVGISLLGNLDILCAIPRRILTEPAELLGFAVIFVLCLILIWFGGRKRHE